jgi:4-hydroxybenzoate polyprenyltransferase
VTNKNEFEKMTRSVIAGTGLIIAGTILSIILDPPKTLWLLTVFLGVIIMFLLLEIRTKRRTFILNVIILGTLIAIISWGDYGALEYILAKTPLIVVIRAIILFVIWLGFQELLSLFWHYNYRYVPKKN